MKHFLCCLSFLLIVIRLSAQPHLAIHPIQLPEDIAYYDNQYSSLYIAHDSLYLMSESRLEDNAEAFLSSASLNDLKKAVDDSMYHTPFIKIPIYNLDIVRTKMNSEGQSYEGLEAMVIKNNTVYLSIETATPSDYCYLIKGHLENNKINIDTSKLFKLAKPMDNAGQHIYNAGYEALEIIKDKLYAFFEYNYFPAHNNVICIDTSLSKAAETKPINKWPFRITDVSNVPHKNYMIGINFFYNGEGKDEIYRVPTGDTANFPLTQGATGFRSYCRLIKITFNGKIFFSKPFITLPDLYWGYNWEGLAAYNSGFFIINDKYTPHRPYRTTLSYLEIKND
ncbi:MAG: hypothetical protein PW786_10830 [Arachidicoccus sp.]|nr:hypothetical protein [Arachidicoccus sp.]